MKSVCLESDRFHALYPLDVLVSVVAGIDESHGLAHVRRERGPVEFVHEEDVVETGLLQGQGVGVDPVARVKDQVGRLGIHAGALHQLLHGDPLPLAPGDTPALHTVGNRG